MILGYILCVIGEDEYTKEQGVALVYGEAEESIYYFNRHSAQIYKTYADAQEELLKPWVVYNRSKEGITIKEIKI